MRSLLLTCAFAAATLAVNPVVQLSYAGYQGSVYSSGVTAWLGMRYAAPPLGTLRFDAPQPPLKNSSLQQANQRGPRCLGPGSLDSQQQIPHSEDCLFLDVYAPSNATTSSRLPVFYYITGGGYTEESPAYYNATALTNAAGNDMVVVFINYRVGPYGFLASREVAASASQNNGLKDQVLGLQWVHDNVALFGGDPGHVTIGGGSAGGGSIVYLMSAYNGTNTTLNSLYHAAAAQEQTIVPEFTASQFQSVYNNLVSQLNCSSAPDTLACLRSLTTAQFQQSNWNIPLPGGPAAPIFTWAPTFDNDLIQGYTYDLLRQGKVNKVPTIAGDDATGGTIFIQNPQSYNDINFFLRALYPNITAAQLSTVDMLYNTSNVRAVQPSRPWFNIAAQLYDDTAFRCPGVKFTSAARKAGVPGWFYVFNATNPDNAALGASHLSELSALFGGPGNVGGFGTPTWPAAIVKQFQKYWINFIKHFDPNQGVGGQPAWGQRDSTAQQQLWFQSDTTKTGIVNVDALQRLRCEFWAGIGPATLV